MLLRSAVVLRRKCQSCGYSDPAQLCRREQEQELQQPEPNPLVMSLLAPDQAKCERFRSVINVSDLLS